MSLTVKKSGVLDTFQDLGRHGNRRFGINPNGAMDHTSLRVANIVLGNRENEAALEIHFPAPDLEFRRKISFAITGADFCCETNKNTVAGWRPQTAKRGSVLRFKRPIRGQRCYLAVKNGFQLTEWLSSTSTNPVISAGGFMGRRLKKGDEVFFRRPETVEQTDVASFRTDINNDNLLRFVPGPDFRDTTAMSDLVLRKAAFRITSESDRMGYRLSGPPVHVLDPSERLSASVTFGTIQLLTGGQLIILMADHQTTGGYPNIGTVIGPDLPLAAQLGAGDLIRFAPVSVRQAEKAAFDYEKGFSLLRNGLALAAK